MRRDSYLKRLHQLLSTPTLDSEIQVVVEHLKLKIAQGHSIWIIGNGGSASTAEHFETDLSYIRKSSQKCLVSASALTANSSVTTAISNDLGYDFIFSHQLARKASAGDVCFAISASGNSSNLLKAIQVAKKMGLSTVGIVGFDGGHMLNKCDFRIFTRSNMGDYGPVEDIHLAICHYIAEELKQHLFGNFK